MQWFLAIGLLAAIVAIYAQVVEFDFIEVDDPYHVTRNPFVQQGLTTESVRWSFTTWHAGYWIPATWISHMLDVEWFGLHPGGHHATNVLLHAANALLVGFLLFRGSGALLPSAFAAALFALHPLRVESVAWITERKDVLSTFFGLLSIAAYGCYVRRRSLVSYFVSLLAMMFSLASKPMLVSLPIALLLIDFWPLDRMKRMAEVKRCLLEKVPYVLVSLSFGIVTILAQTEAMHLGDAEIVASHHVSLPLRLANASVGAVRYLGMSIWPTDLSIVYPHPNFPGGTPWEAWQVAGAIATLAGLTISALAVRNRRPHLAVGWFWFLATLAPVSGVVQSGVQGLADRFTYVPMLGLCVMVAWSLDEFLYASRSKIQRALVMAAAAVWLLALAFAAWAQTQHWRNTDTIYAKALDAQPTNPMLRTYYGIWLQSAGRLDEATTQYDKAAQTEAYRTVSLLNLGSIARTRNRPDEAIRRYSQVLSIEPDHVDAHVALGEVLGATGQLQRSIEHLDEAVRLSPDNPTTLLALADALNRRPRAASGDARRAVHLAERAVEFTKHQDRRALSTLAKAYGRAGELARASHVRSRMRTLTQSAEMPRSAQSDPSGRP
ncbi:tetratricopeptide repeat protein [Myxococcota bacterium]|nr:tetratricopeptide repeat protein [Myxococcota bacterium]